eukprot:579778-Karenia_brevis.AAC.1
MIASKVIARNFPNESGLSHFGSIRAGDWPHDSGNGYPATKRPNQHQRMYTHLNGSCLMASATNLSPPGPLPVFKR